MMQNWEVETHLRGNAAIFELRRYVWPLNIVRVHQEPEAILGLVISDFEGEARPCLPTTTRAFRKLGKLIFSPPLASYDMRGSGGEQIVATFRLPPYLFAKLTHDLEWNESRLAACMDVRDSAIERTLMAVAHEARVPRFASDLMVEGAGTMITVELARYLHGITKPQVRRGRRFSRAQLDRIHDMLAADPMVTLNALAKGCGVSVRTLTRVYLTTTGKTIGYVAAEARIATAMRLLRDEAIPLKVVAHRVGFANVSCFTSAFKRARGITPGRFRAACHSPARAFF